MKMKILLRRPSPSRRLLLPQRPRRIRSRDPRPLSPLSPPPSMELASMELQVLRRMPAEAAVVVAVAIEAATESREVAVVATEVAAVVTEVAVEATEAAVEATERAAEEATEVATESDWNALLQIAPVEMSETVVADKLQSLFGSSTHVFDSGKQKELDLKIAELHGRKNVQRHRESPPIELMPVLRPAVNEVKKLAKVLRDCGNGVSTVRRELEKKQMIRGLSGHAKDYWIDAVLR